MSDSENPSLLESQFLNHPYRKQMELLCSMFPCLRHMPGTDPWNPLTLAAQWNMASSGERAAIQFVISVWDPCGLYDTSMWASEWSFPPFTLAHFSALDEDNRKAVLAWFAAPFWP